MPVQTALLRIAQGAVSNVIRHAEATRAVIDLTVDGNDVGFTVTDNGRGFDPDRIQHLPDRPQSFGLRATRERVEQLGGVLTVDTAPGRGTTVSVALTVDRQDLR